MSSRFKKYIENYELPILIVHGEDCTLSILLSENDVNRVKLCSYSTYEKLTHPSPELQWYVNKMDDFGGVTIIRAVKTMLHIPHVSHDTDTVHSLFDLDKFTDDTMETTNFYGMMDEIVKVLR